MNAKVQVMSDQWQPIETAPKDKSGLQHYEEALAACVQPAPGWNPIGTAPFNMSVLVFVPNCDHYGPGIYRAIRVNMGTGIRWHSTCWAMGRDFTGDNQPTHWMPLPPPPAPHREGMCR